MFMSTKLFIISNPKLPQAAARIGEAFSWPRIYIHKHSTRIVNFIEAFLFLKIVVFLTE